MSELKMTLSEYTAEVNLLSKERTDQLNVEYEQGKCLFGASLTVFTESMLKVAYESGVDAKLVIEQSLDVPHKKL